MTKNVTCGKAVASYYEAASGVLRPGCPVLIVLGAHVQNVHKTAAFVLSMCCFTEAETQTVRL